MMYACMDDVSKDGWMHAYSYGKWMDRKIEAWRIMHLLSYVDAPSNLCLHVGILLDIF